MENVESLNKQISESLELNKKIAVEKEELNVNINSLENTNNKLNEQIVDAFFLKIS